jgi:MerR family redox-sensitive transcriptional activator SoxR
MARTPSNRPSRCPKVLTIGQLATRGGIAASALRFYESQGLLESSRVDHNQRRYDRDALRRVAFIRAAQKRGPEPGRDQAGARQPARGPHPHPADWEALAGGWKAQLDERIRLIGAAARRPRACIGCGCLSLETCALYNPSDIAYLLGHGAQYLKGRTAADAGVQVATPVEGDQ